MITLFCVSVISAQSINVPPLDNLSQSNAEEILIKSGFEPKFKECFSLDVKKYYIIPKSQDPEAGTPYKSGEIVTSAVSRGPLPVTTGKSISEAMDLLDNYNLSYEIVKGRNTSIPDGYIYRQVPTEAGCIYPKFEIKLFANSTVKAEILTPSEDGSVSSMAIIKGKIDPYLLPGEYIWIGVKPYNSIENWWPQSNGPIEPVDGYIEGYASLSGKDGDRFEIAILLMDEELNSIISDWEIHSSYLNNWPPITKGDPLTNKSISKSIIEKRILASINVTLHEPLQQSNVEIRVANFSNKNEGIENATIRVTDGSNSIIEQFTDSNGKVQIAGTPGNWVIKVSAEGYLSSTVSIAVDRNAKNSVNFFLQNGEQFDQEILNKLIDLGII